MPLPLPKAPPLTIRGSLRNPFSSFFHSLLFCFEVMRRHAWFVERLIQMVVPILLETDGGASLGPPVMPVAALFAAGHTLSISATYPLDRSFCGETTGIGPSRVSRTRGSTGPCQCGSRGEPAPFPEREWRAERRPALR